MQIDVFFGTAGITPADVSGRAVAVIDVLRASTSIAVALDNGAKAIVPFEKSDDVVERSKAFAKPALKRLSSADSPAIRALISTCCRSRLSMRAAVAINFCLSTAASAARLSLFSLAEASCGWPCLSSDDRLLSCWALDGNLASAFPGSAWLKSMAGSAACAGFCATPGEGRGVGAATFTRLGLDSALAPNVTVTGETASSSDRR